MQSTEERPWGPKQGREGPQGAAYWRIASTDPFRSTCPQEEAKSRGQVLRVRRGWESFVS